MGRSHIRARAGSRVEGYGASFRDLPQPFDPWALFGRPAGSAPLELEIGSGKGSFLVAEGGMRPETLFLGVERAGRYFRYAADRLRRRERANARALQGDGMEVLLALPEASLAGVHVYFPDPWPKRRHRGRRLVDDRFLEAVERALAPDARLRLATDSGAYFAAMRSAFDGRERLLREVPYPAPADAAISNFERKYRAEGRSIHRIAATRTGAPWTPSPDWAATVAAVERETRYRVKTTLSRAKSEEASRNSVRVSASTKRPSASISQAATGSPATRSSAIR